MADHDSEGWLPPRSPREAILDIQGQVSDLVANLSQEKGERPSVRDTSITLRGIHLALGVAADRIGDTEGLRPAVDEALGTLYGDGPMGPRMDRAAEILRNATGRK